MKVWSTLLKRNEKVQCDTIFHHKIGKNSKAEHDNHCQGCKKRSCHAYWWQCELPQAPGEGTRQYLTKLRTHLPAAGEPTSGNLCSRFSLNNSTTPMHKVTENRIINLKWGKLSIGHRLNYGPDTRRRRGEDRREGERDEAMQNDCQIFEVKYSNIQKSTYAAFGKGKTMYLLILTKTEMTNQKQVSYL